MVFERLLLIGVLNMKNIKEYEKEFYFIFFSCYLHFVVLLFYLFFFCVRL